MHDQCERVPNKALVIALCPIYLFIALFAFFVVAISRVDAATTLTFKSWGCGNDVDSSGYNNSYSWQQCYGRATWLNVDFPQFQGSFQSHAKIEFQFNDSNNSTGYKSVNAVVYVNGNPVFDGITASCPVNGSTATCDIYYNGLFTSNSNLIIQLQLTGSYFKSNTFNARVSGSVTYDTADAGLNNGSFQQGVNSIITNQNKNKQDIIDNQNKNTQDIINSNNKTQQEISETNDFLKDDTPPSSDISSLGNVTGLLPPGPLDSLLNLPFQFLSIVVSSLGDICVPLEMDFVYDSKLTLPCLSSTIYDNMPSGLMVFVNLIPTTFLLIVYFKHLYKKVERATSLETNSDDEWGCI